MVVLRRAPVTKPNRHEAKPARPRIPRFPLRSEVPSRLTALLLPDVQRWADTLAAEGLAPQTVRNIVNVGAPSTRTAACFV